MDTGIIGKDLNILIVNDDGITSRGIDILAEVAGSYGKVYVIAPDSQKSGYSHKVTVDRPLKVTEVDMKSAEKAWSIDGTPADCVKLGVDCLLDDKPDIVLSGINHGANFGTDALYSGTIQSAYAGALLGIKSMAISYCARDINNEDLAFQSVRLIMDGIACLDINGGIWNINIPDVEKSKGLRFTRQVGIRRHENMYTRVESDCLEYRFTGRKIPNTGSDEELDEFAIRKGYVSATPLSLYWTDLKVLKGVKAILE
jgi:5'-nucleotidase